MSTAIKTALGLLHLPGSLRRVRSAPLPADIETLLRIAAGDEQVAHEAALLTERSPRIIRDAAVFYIEQVLLSPESDAYRVLGLAPEASPQELRRNMALLMSWLHPDKDLAGDRAVLAARVSRAWNDLRSPDRRAAYDAASAQTKARARPHSRSRKFMNGTALAHHAPSRRPSWTHESELRLDEHDNLFRRGWSFLRRALRPRSSP